MDELNKLHIIHIEKSCSIFRDFIYLLSIYFLSKYRMDGLMVRKYFSANIRHFVIFFFKNSIFFFCHGLHNIFNLIEFITILPSCVCMFMNFTPFK